MSLSARLSTPTRARLGYFLHIRGIPLVLKTHASINASAILGGVDTYTEVVALTPELFSQGEETLDYESRTVKGGGLTLSVVDSRGARALQDIVQPRRRRSAFLTADLSSGGSTLTVNTTGTITAGDVLYLGSETIIAGTVASATSLTGCTRARFGSIAEAHVAGTFDGEGIFHRAPSWKGRKVTLYAVAMSEHRGGLATNAAAIGYYQLSAVPRLVAQDLWQIECAPWIEHFLEAKCGVGLTDVECTSLLSEVGGGTGFAVSVADDTQFDIGTRETYLRLQGSHDFEGVNGGAILLPNAGALAGLLETGEQLTGWTHPLRFSEVKSVRHIALVDRLDELLLSVTGDGSAGAQDVYPGAQRASRDGRTWRMGAALAATDVDTLALSGGRRQWWYVLDEQTEVAEILRDWCVAQDRIAVLNSAGQLTAKRLSADESDATFSFVETRVLEPGTIKTAVDEDSIFTSVRIRCSYSPLSQEYLFDDVITDFELLKKYPHRTDEMAVESKGIGVEVSGSVGGDVLGAGRPASMSRGELENFLRSMQVRGGRTPILLSFTYGLEAHTPRVGDIVNADFPSWPDGEGGTLTTRTARVASRRPRWKDGAIDFTLEILDKLYKVAPSAVISAVSTTTVLNDTITLASSTYGASSDADQDFDVVGLDIRVWDASAGTSVVRTVAARVSATQLRLSAGVTVTTGEDWITWDDAGTNAALSPTNGDSEEDFLIAMPADGVAAAAGGERRWR